MNKTLKLARKKSRIVEIDFARGVFIMFMIVDHLFFDFMQLNQSFLTPIDKTLIGLSNLGYDYWNWPLRIGFRFFVLSMFFFISGISTTFSKNNLKRGLIIFLVGEAVSLFFYLGGLILEEDIYVFFGAITCFGVSILIYTLVKFLFKKFCPNHMNDFKWIALSLGILIVAIGLMFDCWNISNSGAPHLNDDLSWNNFIYVIIGKYQDAYAADWLPLFPYMGFLFVGSFIGETLYADKKSYFKKLPDAPTKSDSLLKKVGYYGLVFPYKGIKNVITFSGRKSLYFYILHQVVLILILGIVFLSMGYQLQL